MKERVGRGCGVTAGRSQSSAQAEPLSAAQASPSPIPTTREPMHTTPLQIPAPGPVSRAGASTQARGTRSQTLAGVGPSDSILTRDAPAREKASNPAPFLDRALWAKWEPRHGHRGRDQTNVEGRRF